MIGICGNFPLRKKRQREVTSKEKKESRACALPSLLSKDVSKVDFLHTSFAEVVEEFWGAVFVDNTLFGEGDDV